MWRPWTCALLALIVLNLACGSAHQAAPAHGDVPASDAGLDAGDGPVGDAIGDGDAPSAGETDVPKGVVDSLADDVQADEAGRAPADSDLPPLDASEGPLWRSGLYPEAWEPGWEDAEGRSLHDFSYAGYHRGELPLPEPPPGTWVDVLDHGADPEGGTDSTAAFQAAIDEASANPPSVVHVPPGLFHLQGQLEIASSHVVLAGDGPEISRMVFSQSDGMSYQSHIRLGGADSWGGEVALVADGLSRASTVEVADASTFEIGDDVALGWVISELFVAEHGMTGVWQAFNGDWHPFFFRRVSAVNTEANPHTLTFDVPLRYPARVSNQASVRHREGVVREVGVQGLGLSNAVSWSAAWAQTQVHIIGLVGVADAWVRDVKSFVSPNGPESGLGAGAHLQSGGVLVSRSSRVTIADSVMAHAEHIGSGGNGYLFEVRASSEVLTRDCVGHHGRHNFIQNWGFGTTGCVWLRVHSHDGVAGLSELYPYGIVGMSEFHHSLATANLIDSSVFDDGFSIVNRGDWSSGAGHTGTESVLWNTGGAGLLTSYQFGWGYVIGTQPGLEVSTKIGGSASSGTEPEDWREGEGASSTLVPQSLYVDQHVRRLGED
jgi:hypothetical protein